MRLVLGVEGDGLSGDGLVVAQVAQFGEQAVAGLVGGESLVGDGEAHQRGLVLVGDAQGEDVHAAAVFFARHVGKGDAVLDDAVAFAFFGIEAAAPDFAGVGVEVVGVEVVRVVDGVVDVAGEVVAGDLPQFEFDGVHVAAFDGQRRIGVKYEGFATGGEAHHRFAVASADGALFGASQFEVVLCGQFGVDADFVIALPDAVVADFVAAVARFAFGGGFDGDAFAPVLLGFGEEGFAKFEADLWFVLLFVHVNVGEFEGEAVQQGVVLFFLVAFKFGREFCQRGQGEGDAVAVGFHDAFVQREVVAQPGFA